jgi:asparagine synthase (glutamine-hydrolysing)
VLPFDRWMRGALRRPIEEMVRDPRSAAAVGLRAQTVQRLWDAFQGGQGGLYWSRVWAIYVLMEWCHRYGVFI